LALVRRLGVEEDGTEEETEELRARYGAAQLVRLRNEGEISSEVMRRVEHELDLEESRLEV
jgi:hypothetical protein